VVQIPVEATSFFCVSFISYFSVKAMLLIIDCKYKLIEKHQIPPMRKKDPGGNDDKKLIIDVSLESGTGEEKCDLLVDQNGTVKEDPMIPEVSFSEYANRVLPMFGGIRWPHPGHMLTTRTLGRKGLQNLGELGKNCCSFQHFQPIYQHSEFPLEDLVFSISFPPINQLFPNLLVIVSGSHEI
jgi:hypothetical protein